MANNTPVASAKIFGISVLVSNHGCDTQPYSYEYCGEGTKWFWNHCKAAHHCSVLTLIWLAT